MRWAGCKSPLPHLPEGRGEAFFLDILFHRMSEMAIYRQPSRVALSGALDGRQVCVEPYAYEIATLCPHSACLFVQRFRRCSSIAERIEQRADIRCAATDPIANRSLRHRQDWLSLDGPIASRRLRSQAPSRADGLLLVSDGEVRRRKRTVLPRRGSDGRPS